MAKKPAKKATPVRGRSSSKNGLLKLLKTSPRMRELAGAVALLVERFSEKELEELFVNEDLFDSDDFALRLHALVQGRGEEELQAADALLAGLTGGAGHHTASRKAKKPPKTATSVPAHVLTAQEMRLAVEFFDQAAYNYADHSCNDFELPDTPARRKLAKAAMRLHERASGNEAQKLFVC